MERRRAILDPKIKNKLENIQYEAISQGKSILSMSNTKGYYPIEKSAPTSILQTENGSVGCLTSFQNGRPDLVKPRRLFSFQKLKLADRGRIKGITGHDVGTISLIGLELPYLLDKEPLRHGFIFDGADGELLASKISSEDLLEVNEIIGMFG